MGHETSAVAEPDLDFGDQKWLNFDLALSENTNAKLDRMAKEIGVTKDDVFARAFGLLELAIDAKKEGRRLAVIDADNSIERVISLD
jgi:hypothetical protein